MQIYIAAYQGELFFYRPRCILKQTIGDSPDLILSPSRSAVAGRVGGCIDRRKPHQINHVITGFLGCEEIVLAAFDDGDVVAYYMKDAAEHILPSCPRQRPPKPKKFFHENVGRTAWGLAIHAKSRLIAVSSNLHEVTVFALGLKGSPQGPPSRPPFSIDYVDKSVQKRMRNWRIIVLFGRECDNIPSIAFMDDKDGYAEKIVAQDTEGPCWIADIWKSCTAPIKIPAKCEANQRVAGHQR